MSLLARLVEKAEAQAGLHYRNPSLPHACGIPGGVSIGNKIYIQGMVSSQSHRFAVNLQRGADEETADIYFHLDARFQGTPVVVRNTRSSGQWGKEERDGGCPFTPASAFLMVLTAYSDNYEVEVNGNVFASLKHREGLPLTNVTHLALQGDIVVRALHIPVETMPKNLRLSIPDNAKVGDLFTIRGTVPHGADKFTVNLQCGPGKSEDIVYHFNPRISDGVVVRNSRSDDQWGKEDRVGGMPFTEGECFTLLIAVMINGFRAWVNDKEFANLPHRLDVTSACYLFLEGDLNTENILVDSIPRKFPPDCGNVVPKFHKTKAEMFFPTLPATTAIAGGLNTGQSLVLSGIVDKEPKRFHVTLQCGAAEDSDIALHFNPRWDDGEVTVINSCTGGSWGSEVRVTDHFPFVAGLHFELQILCRDDGYLVVVNGVQQATFPHRLSFDNVSHVTTAGSLAVHRLLIA